jgi:hypothetical protein
MEVESHLGMEGPPLLEAAPGAGTARVTSETTCRDDEEAPAASEHSHSDCAPRDKRRKLVRMTDAIVLVCNQQLDSD